MTKDNRRPRVLVCDDIADIGLEMLRAEADVDQLIGMSPTELAACIHDYEGLLVRAGTTVTANVIDHALRLKVIGRAGSGLDNIDVVAAKNAGIEVVNAPDANTLSVAEHTFAFMLAAARDLPRVDLGIKRGEWIKREYLGTGLAGKTLGIVGFGRIGYQVAIRAKAFGMKVLVNQDRPTPELNLEVGVEAVDLHDLLAQSDFVTLHVPLNTETANMIGEDQLARMKPTAILINTARGGVVDENALLKALNNDEIRGAALDVFVEEPATNSELAQHARVIATPHIAAETEDALRAAAVTTVERMLDILRDIEPATILPLRVVPAKNVIPHESYDQKRVDRLARRLRDEKFLLNPPIVMPMGDDKYMVLDGATRTTALQQLDFPHMVVQVVTSEDGLELKTWYHVIHNMSPDDLHKLIVDLPLVSPVETTPEHAERDMILQDALCYLHMTDSRVLLVLPAPGASRLDALNSVTEAYIDATNVSRTLDDNMITLELAHADMTAVVIFPKFTVQQVIEVTRAGRYVPAGITRFIIPGRILRLRADLDMLRSEELTLREKNRLLHEDLVGRENAGKIRFYQEPVYLLDE